MNSRNLLNITLAMVLAGLVLLVIYEPGKATRPPADKLTTIDQADITTVVIEQPQQAIIKLLKNNNGWQMQEPLSISANNEIIDNLLEIVNTTSHSSYPVSGINLEQLQLTTPRLTIHFNNTSLSFGNTDALRGYRYVLTGDRVHLITDRFTHLIRGKLTALVNPSPLPGNIKLTKLVFPEITLQLEQDNWSTIPDNKFENADQIQQLIDEWRNARAIEISLVSDTRKQQDTGNASAIEIFTSNKGNIQFNMAMSTDEIILTRSDIGLRYHFERQAGERLLGITKPEFKTGKTQ